MNEQKPANTFVSDQSFWPADHPKVNYGRIGVLLLNLGTPDATDYWLSLIHISEPTRPMKESRIPSSA